MDAPIQFSLNEPFPLPELIPPIDGTRTIPGVGFSALMVCVENPRPQEIQIFTNHPIRYGVYAAENIPYFLLEFSNTPWVVEGSFHVIGGNEDINEWLENTSNVMSCFLIDCNTHLLKAMRVFSVASNVIDEIKNNCREQRQRYSKQSEILEQMKWIEARFSTQQMILKSEMYEVGNTKNC
jgi:hypothetical protein